MEVNDRKGVGRLIMLLLATHVDNRLAEFTDITTASNRPAASAAEVSRYPFFRLVILSNAFN